MYEKTVNHVKFYQLVKTNGLRSAYVAYVKDNGTLDFKSFENKYSN
jgi:hypothetical protein